jgi:hypothetical protein
MRLKNFELAIEEFVTHPSDGIVEKSTDTSGLPKGEGGAFFTFRNLDHEDEDDSFFNIFQIKNANIVSEKLTYSGSMSAKTEDANLDIRGYTLMITKNQ